MSQPAATEPKVFVGSRVFPRIYTVQDRELGAVVEWTSQPDSASIGSFEPCPRESGYDHDTYHFLPRHRG